MLYNQDGPLAVMETPVESRHVHLLNPQSPSELRRQSQDSQDSMSSQASEDHKERKQPLPEAESDPSQLESDKRAIYKHPLFPLLVLLFEKCELATQSIDAPSGPTFEADIKVFVQQHCQDKKPPLTGNSEIDDLVSSTCAKLYSPNHANITFAQMIRALQVLRIHLLELEKVQELCKDFCHRYITCLKGKMQSEQLLRSEYGGYDSDEESIGSDRSSSNKPYSPLATSPQVQAQAQVAAAAAAAMMGQLPYPTANFSSVSAYAYFYWIF